MQRFSVKRYAIYLHKSITAIVCNTRFIVNLKIFERKSIKIAPSKKYEQIVPFVCKRKNRLIFILMIKITMDILHHFY